MNKLKPCPFCGGEAKIKVMSYRTRTSKYFPSCVDRHCLGRNTSKYYPTPIMAVNEWNRRAE